MHIPDGYLSPQTCAVTYAAALPFWYVASRRVSALMQTRAVPLIAVVSAFCFVVMMFNLPLPGGTSGHAVGMTIAAIVLGPWPAVAAISIALLVQAVFFGDGGLTAYGANCLNMGIVGPFAGWALYHLFAGSSGVASRRRVVAAALAGYLSINVAALCAGVEFGVQPMLFHAADGTPLYAPYPLSVAVPAMLIGHLTFAGLAEAVITGGLVAYLQRADPTLLTSPGRGSRTEAGTEAGTEFGKDTAAGAGWRGTRRLWAGVGALMVLSPLGLLAAGTAWGEWRAADFASRAGRDAMAAASGAAPPQAPPAGLARLSEIWTAPMPDYAPAFLHSEIFGYILSAMVGGGLIVLVFAGLSALAARRRIDA
ncbi:cobalt transporter CbiM [Acidimangrovimonas sediminis]|uniref:cobalt transporter CbiM n=1 Tax=Acidimangrovimonas sediminis TaxID=2056283 RepID=UPI000C7FDE93|nr:cobalt transporter CbiM [Acidimangrovimonas sediminis]